MAAQEKAKSPEEVYSALLHNLVMALSRNDRAQTEEAFEAIRSFIWSDISYGDPDNLPNQKKYPGAEDMDEFLGDIFEEYMDIPYLAEHVKREEVISELDADEEDETVETEASEFPEVLQPGTELNFNDWVNSLVAFRRSILSKIKNGEADKVTIEALKTAIDIAEEADFVYPGKNVASMQEKLQKMLKNLEGAEEVEPGVHPVFEQLSDAIAVIENLLNDRDFDPRQRVDTQEIALDDAENDTVSYQKLLSIRLTKATAYWRIYSPDNATDTASVDRYYALENDYIIPAASMMEVISERISDILSQELSEWKTSLENVDNYPNVVFVKKEAAREMPARPYTADTPQRRIERIKVDGDATSPYFLALDEINEVEAAIDDLDPHKDAKNEYLQQQVQEFDNYLTSLYEMIREDKLGEEAANWEADVADFKAIIQEILALPLSTDPFNQKDRLLVLDTALKTIYEELLELGKFDTSTENTAINAGVADLVGADKKTGKYSVALEKITKILKPVHEEMHKPINLSWQELIDVIAEKNIDVYDHVTMAQPSANPYNVSVYNAFHARKGALDIDAYESEAQFLKEDQERIDSVAWIVLSKIEAINQNEGQIPTCTRADLFPMLTSRQMSRDTILKSTTYHPEHGELMREMLDDVILAVADRNHPEISYAEVTSSGKGRSQINKYMRTNFYDRAMGTLYQDLSAEERKKKVEHFFDLANVVYNLFDLLSISFAELQKNTMTGAHHRTKGGKPYSAKNYIAIHRPDAAMVHNTQRYDSPSHVSAWYLLYMKGVPSDYGRFGDDPEGQPYRSKLEHQQEEIIAFQNAFHDVSSFTGENGIDPTSIFDPLFPDTRSFLHLATNHRGRSELLEFGNDVWGVDDNGQYRKLGRKGETITLNGKQVKLKQDIGLTELYEDVAMAGFEKALELTFGDLPSTNITADQILNSSNTGGDNPNLGHVDIMINKACGMGKMYPGRHMEAIPHFFTHYLFRLFSRYQAGPKYREKTYQDVVKKIQNAAQPKGGLGGYPEIAAQVIRNISAEKYKGWSDEKILTTASSKFKMGDVLNSGLYKRRKERIHWVLMAFHKEGLTPPNTTLPIIGESLVAIKSFVSKFSQTDQRRFWKMVNGEMLLPTPEINRNISPFKSVDESH